VRVLIDYRPALRERTGVGEYTHELVKALLAAYPSDGTANGLAVSLFSSSFKDRLVPGPELAGATTVDRRIPVRLLNFVWHRLGWPAAEALTGAAFDVTHSLHPLLLPSQTAAQVVTIHDLNFLAHPERTRAEIRRDYPVLARAHAHRADAIIVPSQYTADEVARALGVARERIAVCPPGAPDWPARAAAPKEGYVLFFGTLEPRKNVGGLLDAYERLMAVSGTVDAVSPAAGIAGHTVRRAIPELVLAGGATDDARPWLQRIARPPLLGHVRHVGYIDRADRRALYAGARVLVQPSFDEGFGLPVLEAMSLGVPVVAASRGSLPEVLGDAGTLVDPDRPDDIANGLARVLDDEPFAARCVTRGIARARTFSWRTTAHRVVDTYRQAIARRAERAPRA
jgi:glycosyltransferase involved in cell wall biosynthesis